MLSSNSAKTRLIVAIMVTVPSFANAGDWLTMPSTYTHDPSSGARIDQYAPRQPSISRVDPTYRESGYRQYRSTLQYGQAADNYHTVERWGEQVRPYGEWRFPFRPYSSPYPAWGAPLAGMNIGGFFPGWSGGYGHPGVGGPRRGQLPEGAPVDPANGFGPGSRVPRGGFRGNGNFQGFNNNGGASLTPYPAFPQGGYPVPPYYDGAYPTFGDQPRLNDRRFYFKPTQ